MAVVTGWLPPLLDRIARDNTTVVCPDIDTINDNTLQYEKGSYSVGGFNWHLQVQLGSGVCCVTWSRGHCCFTAHSPEMLVPMYLTKCRHIPESHPKIGDTCLGLWLWRGTPNGVDGSSLEAAVSNPGEVAAFFIRPDHSSGTTAPGGRLSLRQK